MDTGQNHINVFICTFRRLRLLQGLLHEVVKQETNGLFTYSVVVADNDGSRSVLEGTPEPIPYREILRRECFEEIGGYLPVKGGSIDHIAVITARMKGWKTQTFTETTCLHHRAMGSAGKNLLKSQFKLGMKDYLIGNHPL